MTARFYGLSSRTVTTGGHPAPSGSRGANTHANLIPLPAGSISRSEPLLKGFNIAQALIDGAAMFGCSLIVGMIVASVPLAIFLLVFAKFH